MMTLTDFRYKRFPHFVVSMLLGMFRDKHRLWGVMLGGTLLATSIILLSCAISYPLCVFTFFYLIGSIVCIILMYVVVDELEESDE